MKTKSFTLIELLVVIVIIGILAGVITLSVTSNINKAQDLKVSNTLLSISKILKTDSLNSFPIEVVACNLKDSCSTLKAQLDLPSTTEDIYYKTSTSGKFFVLYANKPSNTSLGFEITSIDENVKEVPSFDNLVAYYPLAAGTTNGATVSDMSPNSNNGTNYGASSTVGVDGNMGTAMSFDGASNRVLATLSNPILANQNYTQSIWANAEQLKDSLLFDDYNRYEHYIAIDATGRVKVDYYNNAHVVATSIKTVEVNTWYHIVGVVESGVYIKLYVNGELWAVNNSLGGVQSKILNDVVLGAAGSIGEKPFDGYLENARLYNRALSQEEVILLYNNKK